MVLWFILILLLVFTTMTLLLKWQQVVSTQRMQVYGMKNLLRLSTDLGATYDFGKDAKGLTKSNLSLARDFVDRLLEYYDDNVQTVRVVIDQIVKPTTDEERTGTFERDATDFIRSITQHIKPAILQQTQYFERFFGMVIQTLDVLDPDYQKIVQDIQNIVKNI